MFEPITLLVYAAGALVVGGALAHRRRQLSRLRSRLAEHPRVEPRAVEGRALFAVVVDCGPRGAVSILAARSMSGISWRLEAPLLALPGALTVQLDRDAVRCDDEGVRARLERDASLRPGVQALFTDTWEVQWLLAQRGQLALEALDRGQPGDLDVEQVIRRADRLARVAESIARALGEPGAGDLVCPMCRSVPLVPRAGVLLEAACPNCRGRFLGPDAARRLLEGELGRDPMSLKALASDGAPATLGCPSCATRLRPVIVDEEIVDLCTGCGSLWLDESELRRLSRGRYQEVGL